MVGSGETYSTEVVNGDELVKRILEATDGPDPKDWRPDWVKHVEDSLSNEDEWTLGDVGCVQIPCEWSIEIGETDHIRLFRMTHVIWKP